MSVVKRLSIAISVTLAIVLLAVVSVAIQTERFMNTPLGVAADGAVFDIAVGSSFSTVAKKLKLQNVISDDKWLRLYVRWHGNARDLQAGEYFIAAGTTPHQLMQKFTSGQVRLHSFTLVEGWNYREVLAALHAIGAIQATLTDEDWPAFLTSLESRQLHPEGLFLPETYHFARNTTDKVILIQAFELMQQALTEEWQGRSAASAVDSKYDALILASIVEKETARADERPRIAGVFTRRLEKGMRLQTDPTVIYGIGAAFDGNLTRLHLRTDTPYNTYTRHGLPPTPIAMPGRAAIHAALHPAAGEELFFVASGNSDGSHRFSTTKAEHDAAVADYLKQLRLNRAAGQGQ